MCLFFFCLIGIFEIVGGFFGVVVSVCWLLLLGLMYELLMVLIVFVLFGFILVVGVLLVEGSEWGVLLLCVVQLLQLLLLVILVLSYVLYVGGFVNVFVIVQGGVWLGLDYCIGMYGLVLVVVGLVVVYIGINLFVLLLWLVFKLC